MENEWLLFFDSYISESAEGTWTFLKVIWQVRQEKDGRQSAATFVTGSSTYTQPRFG